MSNTPNIAEVIQTYMKLRDKKAEVEATVKEQVDAIKSKMAKLEAFIKEEADRQGVTSFKSKYGTAFLTTVDYATVDSWDDVVDFIKTEGRYDMLEKRISKNAVRAYIEDNKAVPPGVSYGTKLSLNVRKPAAGSE